MLRGRSGLPSQPDDIKAVIVEIVGGQVWKYKTREDVGGFNVCEEISFYALGPKTIQEDYDLDKRTLIAAPTPTLTPRRLSLRRCCILSFTIQLLHSL